MFMKGKGFNDIARLFLFLFILLLFPAPLYGEAGEGIKDESEKSSLEIEDNETAPRPELVIQSGHSSHVMTVAYSPDGKYVVSGSIDNTIKIWDVSSGACLRTMQGHSGVVRSVAFSPDGKYIASGGDDCKIKIWNVQTGKCEKNLFCITKVFSISFSPDGNFLASDGAYQGVVVWNVQSDKCEKIMNGHETKVTQVVFSPDGKFIASWSQNDGVIIIWDVQTGKLDKTIEDRSGLMSSIAFTSDGKYLASAVNIAVGYGLCGKIKLWDVKTTKCEKTIDAFSVIDSFAFSQDGKLLALGGHDHNIFIWDIKADTYCEKGMIGHAESINSVAFSSDCKFLVSGSSDSTIKIWNVQTKECERTLSGRFNLIEAILTPFAKFSSDGRFIVLYLCDLTKKWNIQTGKYAGIIDKRELSYNHHTAFSPDGNLWAFNPGSTIYILNIQTRKHVWEFECHSKKFSSFAFSPDSQFLASGRDDGTIEIWDLKTGKCSRTIEGHFREINCIAFSHDNKYLASGHGSFFEAGTIIIWNVQTGVFERELDGHSSLVSSISFSPDGKFLVSGSDDTTIKIWDVQTGKCERTIEGYSGMISSVEFSRSGNYLMSGSIEGIVKIWNPDTGQCLATLMAYDDENWIVFTDEGFFDGSPEGWKNLLWTVRLKLYPIEIYFNEFYQPGLLADVMRQGRSIKEILKDRGDPRWKLDFAGKDRRIPKVALSIPIDDKTIIASSSTDSITSPGASSTPVVAADNTSNEVKVDKRMMKIRVTAWEASGDEDAGERKGQPSGVKNVRLFRNGVLLRRWDEKWEGTNKPIELECEVPLMSGKNVFTAYAFNIDNVKSLDADPVVITGAENLSPPAKAYVVSIGIDKYSNEDFNLNYCKKDAEESVKALQEHLPNPPFLKENIIPVSVLDDKATKQGILDALKDVMKKANPEDTVIVTYAGHGILHEGHFYIIPHDMGNSSKEEKLALHGISDEELESILPLKIIAMNIFGIFA